MTRPDGIGRRGVIAGLGAMIVAGCDRVADSRAGSALFRASERLHQGAHRALTGRTALVPEYAVSDISPFFRGNGSRTVDTDAYRAALANGFPEWRVAVPGPRSPAGRTVARRHPRPAPAHADHPP